MAGDAAAAMRLRLETAILDLLGGRSGSLCPSEAARRVGGDDWRKLMPLTRDAGRRLAQRGLIVVTQKGRDVDPDTARGPVRYARPAVSDDASTR